MKRVVAFFILILIGLGMLSIVAEMPTFGHHDNPQNNEIPDRYLNQIVEDTASLNAVSSVISDYRAFDTLGEATVLFTAVAAIYGTLKAGSKKGE